jgi:xanthine dehydrogenase accessory factor
MSAPVLYVFGGGHVSLQIVPMAALVGFNVVVIDDRPEFADPRKFPEAMSVHEYPFEGVFDRLPIDQSSYIVIVTRGHLHDRTVVMQALKTQARYIGMMGSRRKKAIVYKKLLEEGFTQADLDRIYSPIGIGIEAETPEELAVSIVAELIKVRAEVL